MTNEQLAEIEKLHAAATPGEWKGDRLDGTVKYRLQSEDCNCDPDELWNCPHLVLDVDHKNRTSGFLGKYSSENEKLVIVLHNAFPSMAKALREAREVLGLILETDALPHWAFDAGDDDESLYDMVRRAAGKEPL